MPGRPLAMQFCVTTFSVIRITHLRSIAYRLATISFPVGVLRYPRRNPRLDLVL
ncbi:MAG: hypothetical protein JWP63_4859 [Candidatus Solibacter sp.]|jgi:hypothetical protein|nr:hypothetical protein [Candidatus Solibacter sp.]